MSELAVPIEGELVQAPATLFGTNDPEAVIEQATRSATALADVIKKQKLTVTISRREHVRVEGWTLLGSMLGVFPVCVWTRKLEDGWEARVEARTRAGEVVGAAEAECLRSESSWASRDDYALRSMAQTRATSKALRQPLGFVMQLAGFDATPAEEMPSMSGEKMTTPQRNKIFALIKDLDTLKAPPPAPHADWKAVTESRAHDWFNHGLKDLTKDEASRLIEAMTAHVKALMEEPQQVEPTFQLPGGQEKLVPEEDSVPF
jgi:hypothetical protein